MKVASMADPAYTRDLGSGLVLRWSREGDAPRIAETASYVFRRTAEEAPNRLVAAWISDILSGRHPNAGPGDYAIVEEKESGRAVCGTCLLSCTIELDGIRIPFGRPEAVFTLPEHRDRGLVRAVFELIHARSEARGHLLQGITGIPYFYRLFDYEYAADLGGEVSVYFAAIPELKKDAAERFTLRCATSAEIPAVRRLYDRDRARYGLTTPMDEAYLCWIAFGQGPHAAEGWTTRLIVDGAGAVAGYVLTHPVRESDEINVLALGTREGIGLADVLPSTLRSLKAAAGELIPRLDDLPPPARVRLQLWPDHPAYALLKEEQVARRTPPYAWYIRMPDVVTLLRHLTPLLERRLAASPMAGWTGELRLTFFPRGVRLTFSDGRLVALEEWKADHAWGPRPQAGIPRLVFAKLVLGYRCLSELRDAYPDVRVEDEARPVLEALFPRRPGWLLPLD